MAEPVDALKALAHPLRLRILEALRAGECNVGEIEEATGITQPALSQQLAVLRGAGLVANRRKAKLVFYRLDRGAFDVLAGLFARLGSGKAEPEPPRPRAEGVARFARLS